MHSPMDMYTLSLFYTNTKYNRTFILCVRTSQAKICSVDVYTWARLQTAKFINFTMHIVSYLIIWELNQVSQLLFAGNDFGKPVSTGCSLTNATTGESLPVDQSEEKQMAVWSPGEHWHTLCLFAWGSL